MHLHSWLFVSSRFWLLQILLMTIAASGQHLLISEVAITPTKGEFIEIANPTNVTVSLANHYISDSQEYAILPGLYGNGPQPTIGSRDFIAKFPNDAVLAPHQVIVIAIDGNLFFRGYGLHPDYELYSSDSTARDLEVILDGGDPDISNGGEGISLFYWDGISDLVADVDLVNVGTPSSGNQIIDKTGIEVDGPDADLLPSQYLDEAFSMGNLLSDPESGFSAKRLRIEDGHEITAGGNGFSGHDETSEQLLYTWGNLFTAVTPGTAEFIDNGSGTPPIIGTVVRDQVVPVAATPLNITAYVSDVLQSIESAHLHYLAEGLKDSVAMSLVGPEVFEAQIPEQFNRNEVKVTFWVTATNNLGLKSASRQWHYLGGTSRIEVARQMDSTGQNIHSGTACRLRGIASVATNVFATANHEFYIQGNTGGIKIFELNANGEDVAEGDSVEVVGMLFQRFGELEIGEPEISYSVYDTTGISPQPLPIGIDEVDESIESMLVRLTNLNKHSGDWPDPGQNGKITLVDADSQKIDLFISRETNIDDSPEPTYPIDVIGLLGQRSTSLPHLSDYMIKPRRLSDIQRAGTVIVINEIMYHPPQNMGSSFAYSYLELTNISDMPFDLGNWRIENNLFYKFPEGLTIDPGEYLVLAKEPDSVAAFYGIGNVLGPMHGEFSHEGMSIVLRDRWGISADSVFYLSQAPWPLAANGYGPSLELYDPLTDNNDYRNWGVSDTSGGHFGTPGYGNKPTAVGEPVANNVKSFQLRQNYPNPFNPITTIEFDLPVAAPVFLEIFNVLGQRVLATSYRGTKQAAGRHKFVWDATDGAGNSVASGLYIYRLKAGEFVKMRKMILLR